MPQTDQDRVIALAGLFQASHLVCTLAHTGQYDHDDFMTCVSSLFKIDADDSAEVFGGLTKLRTGLQLINEQLRQPRDMELTRYTIALLTLERKLQRHSAMLTKIGADIRDTQQKLEYFSVDHDNIIARLAEIYATTLSTLQPRIMVTGEQRYLAPPENTNRVRTLLLAGIRSAILWRQSGGSRWSLLFRRRPLLLETRRLLADCPVGT